jgi:hypothetical protein
MGSGRGSKKRKRNPDLEDKRVNAVNAVRTHFAENLLSE